jgi:hypothetical protein
MIRGEVSVMTTFVRGLFRGVKFDVIIVLFNFENLEVLLVKLSFCFFSKKCFLLRNAAFASRQNI